MQAKSADGIRTRDPLSGKQLLLDDQRRSRHGNDLLTEDAATPNGLLYRFTPPDHALPLGKGSLKLLADDAGTLEALRATTLHGTHVPDLSVATQRGTTYRAEWLPVADLDAASVSTRKQFSDDQITRSRKLEGMWWGDGGAYFVCSYARFEDGSAAQHDGQAWYIDPDETTIDLKLYFVYTRATRTTTRTVPTTSTSPPTAG